MSNWKYETTIRNLGKTHFKALALTELIAADARHRMALRVSYDLIGDEYQVRIKYDKDARIVGDIINRSMECLEYDL